MKIYPGDVVYSNGGRPGVVMDRDQSNGKLRVEAKGENYEKARNYGFINGMKPEDRERFTKIVDEVKALAKPEDRVNFYAQKIDEIKNDPRNYRLVRYLTAELAHVMYTEGIQPREFLIDELKVNA